MRSLVREHVRARFEREHWESLTRRHRATAMEGGYLVESLTHGGNPAEHLASVEEGVERLRMLPRYLRDTLCVESGSVWFEQDGRSRRRDYFLAHSEGFVHEFNTSTGERQISSILDAPRETLDGFDSNAPVALGPSCALSLVINLVEMSFHDQGRGLSWPPGLRVQHDCVGSHPAQGLWVDGKGETASIVDNGVVHEGALERAIRQDLRAVWDPEHVPRLAGLAGVPLEPIRIDCGSGRECIATRLQLDALRFLAGPQRGRVAVRAICSIFENHNRYVLAQPMQMEVDPGVLLGSVRAAIGAAELAVDVDPVLGETYGQSPALALHIDVSGVRKMIR